jgi:predicted metal-dependent phosphoesterase TrpH
MFRMARRRGLRALILTDHDTTRHWKPALRAAQKYGLATTQALELSTEQGHLIGYFSLDADERKVARCLHLDTADGIVLHKVDDALARIRECGGLVSVPHPFGPFYPLQQPDFARFDAVEEYNAWIYGPLAGNYRNAPGYGEFYHIAALGGSDAHYPFMVGLGATAIPASVRFDRTDWFLRCLRERTTEAVDRHTVWTKRQNVFYMPLLVPLSLLYNTRYVFARLRRKLGVNVLPPPLPVGHADLVRQDA